MPHRLILEHACERAYDEMRDVEGREAEEGVTVEVRVLESFQRRHASRS